MKLSRLIAGLSLGGPFYAGEASDPEVSGVVHDSRRAAPGDLFVAWRGERHDGSRFAARAVAAGAVAVLAPEGAKRPGDVPPGLPWLTAEEPHRQLAPLAARVYGHPDRELVTAGVTGTNGKSTVAVLLAAMLQEAGRPCGVVGSLGYTFQGRREGRGRTTPEASDLFRLLRRWRDAGAEAVAMEVSSHALALGRVAGMGFDLAAFTNLSRDHLDFHADLDDYFTAKRRLFTMLKDDGRAVVNREDPYGERLIAELPAERTVTWGEAEGDVHAVETELDEGGIRARLATPRGEMAIETPLLGHFNLLNLLTAVACGEALELPREAVRGALAKQQPLPGRMQPVRAGQPFPVYVDYCHTHRALAAALASLRALTGRRILVVFGCGGDRDPGKRPLMGRVAAEGADLAVLTSDNPRGEDPMKIIAAVETGLAEKAAGRYRVEPDRREAIRTAIGMADEGWAVLIAGKGDEAVQQVGTEEHPFYDHDEAVEAIEETYGAA